jgi:hypothetical protein
MATTSTQKKRFSWSSLLSLILAVLPLVLETLETGRDAVIQISPNATGNRLQANVTGVLDGNVETGKKFTIANKG